MFSHAGFQQHRTLRPRATAPNEARAAPPWGRLSREWGEAMALSLGSQVGKLRQPPRKQIVEGWDGAKERCSQPQLSPCSLTSPSESAFRATGTVQRESSGDTELRYMQTNTWGQGHRPMHADNLPCTDRRAWGHVGEPFAHTRDSHTHSTDGCAPGIGCPRAGMTVRGRAT